MLARTAALLFTLSLSLSSVSAAHVPGDPFDATGRLMRSDVPGRPGAECQPQVSEFLPSVRVDDDLNPEHREPVVVWGADGTIHAAYAERAAHYNPELIRYTRSIDGGQTWLAPAVRVNDTAPNAVYFPAIDRMADASLCLVWGELNFAPYNSEIRFSRSIDEGASWSPSCRIHPPNPATDYYRPSITIVHDRIFVAFWEEVAYPVGRPVLVYSDDCGEHWTGPIVIHGSAFAYDTSAPCLAWDETTQLLGVVGHTSDERILFLASADLGHTWSAPVQINTTPSTSADCPDLAAADGVFHAVWNDNRNGQYDTDIWHSSSTGGQTWSVNTRVNDRDMGGNQYEPHLRIGPTGAIHVCWIWCLPFQSNIDLYYSNSADSGASWLEHSPRVNDIPYTVQPYVAWTADLLADRHGAYIFWNDGRTSDYYDNIYMSRDRDPADAILSPFESAGFSIALENQPGPTPRLALTLTRPAAVSLELCDPLGRRLGGSVVNLGAPGVHRLSILGMAGLAPRSGTYFLRAKTEDESRAARVVILR